MTISPLELASDVELLHELCKRAKSTERRAFVGLYLRPDEGPTPPGGWLLCSAARAQEIRETFIMLICKLGMGSPIDYRWLWEALVPQYSLQHEPPQLSIHPQNTSVIDAALISMRRWPMIVDDPQFLERVDELMATRHFSRRAWTEGWEYVDEHGSVMARLKRANSLMFVGI